ncbi:MAG: class SAM-dependent methyltransferase [Tardiphaga sp.]|nr:class SAM-dependent methyltransferase [Tardiphaga sp.]
MKMTIQIINPHNGLPLLPSEGRLHDSEGNSFPIVNGIPRICGSQNYAENFGKQWNLFPRTQIDSPEDGTRVSEQRFFVATAWTPEELAELDVLEVGSGAGRFSRVVLERTKARLWSLDYSTAVEANFTNNGSVAPDRFRLFQASIYEMPFPDNTFDRVFCLGVLQHTPDFESSVNSLILKTKPGGEIVVDFYAIRGWWTKISAKYILRPFTKRLSHGRLLRLIEANVDWMMGMASILNSIGLGALTRFLPMVDLRTLPSGLSKVQLREWTVLDTFDVFSPEHDHPQRLRDVAAMFERNGAKVIKAHYVDVGTSRAAVVRAIKPLQ